MLSSPSVININKNKKGIKMANVTVDVYVDLNSIVNNISPVSLGDSGISVNYKSFGSGNSALLNYIEYSTDGGVTKQGAANYSFDAQDKDTVVFVVHDSSSQNSSNFTNLHWFNGVIPDAGDAHLLGNHVIGPNNTLTTTANAAGTEDFYLNFTFNKASTGDKTEQCAVIWDPQIIVIKC